MTTDAARSRRTLSGQVIRTVGFAAVLLICVMIVFVAYYLVQVNNETHRAAVQVADCTTPGGECYKRGQEQTQHAVQQIINALQELEAQRATTAAALNNSHDDIGAALRQLCAAQGITCPTVR